MIKKIIFGLFGLIVMLTVAFAAVGFVVPFIDYSSVVEINKPRNVVWAALIDRAKAKEWIDGLQSNDIISGDPTEIGSKAKMVLLRDGRSEEFTRELIDIKSPENTSTKLESDYVSHEMSIKLSESDGKTKLLSTEKLTGKNLIARSLMPLIRSRIAGLSQKNFDNLKRFVENGQ